jgi:hypothetical protein
MSSPSTQDFLIVNLATGDTLNVPRVKPASFFWASGRPGVFGYTSFAALAPVDTVQHGPQIPSPGYQDRGQLRELVGNPMAAVSASGPATSAANMRYNPANHDWYAVYASGQLSIHRHSTGQTVPISSGPVEFLDKGSQRPSWSANGEHLSFVRNPGSGAVVTSFHVLNSSGNALTPPQKTFEKAVPDATRAQVDPTGKWVYYLQNGEVTRSINTNPSNRTVKLSAHLEPISDYAISP